MKSYRFLFVIAVVVTLLIAVVSPAFAQPAKSSGKTIVLTKDSAWARLALHKMKAELDRIGGEASDLRARSLIQFEVGQMIGEFYLPSIANPWSKEKYKVSLDDLAAVRKCVLEVQAITIGLSAKYNLSTELQRRTHEQLDDMLVKLDMWSSNSWRAQAEALDRAINLLDERK